MSDRRPDLLGLLRAGVAAVDPAEAVRRAVSFDGDQARIGGAVLDIGSHLQVLAVGKAALPMVTGLSDVLQDVKLHGLAVAPARRSEVQSIVTLHGSHPIPDNASLVAGRRLLAAAAATPPDESTIVLVSGGGSALAVAPATGVSLEWIAESTKHLILNGASIQEINAIRSHVSALKGGGLSRALRGPHVTIAVSDVIDSPPSAIASGPTVIDPSIAEVAALAASKYGLELPDVQARAGHAQSPFVVAADGAVAADAVVSAGAEAGHAMTLHTTRLQGEAKDKALWAIAETAPGTIGVFAGETTVQVSGRGSGGRNQEAALAAAMEMEGSSIRFAAMGTDGIDGASPAAGASVGGHTAQAIRNTGIEPADALENNDSFAALNAVGATIITGPTGTNVGDLWLVDRTAG